MEFIDSGDAQRLLRRVLLEKLKHKVSIAPFAQGKDVVYVLFLREKPLFSAACATMLPEDVLRNLPE